MTQQQSKGRMDRPQTFSIQAIATLVCTLREIAWSDERKKDDETGKRADFALCEFAKAHPETLADFEFLELREYLEQQTDDESVALVRGLP